ncbi:MAG TPA: BlaI/MecI/CopY family transcriptional regulator, partial [Verrucomicrobiae bacterium]|nr:BlaI/MecI/CopY family transcriptional regulator [Verrucomicrobiae bacterium]
ERQIMDAVYRLGRASAADVRRQLPDPPSYSAVRAFLTILERKGQLKHVVHGPRYVYLPTQSRPTMGRVALRQVLNTFFEGSLANAVADHLASPATKLTNRERKLLANLEELEAIRACDTAKTSRGKPIPFQQAREERRRRNR